MKKIIVFTDLDGTLLDEHYSFEPAVEAVEKLKSKGVPIIICTSKTLPEVLHYREALSIKDPFIVENGGAIFIEKDYYLKPSGNFKENDRFYIVEFGTPYEKLIEALKKIQEKGYKLKGFYEMSPEEISDVTGLSLQQSIWAKQRQYDEVIIYNDSKEKLEKLKEELQQMGLSYTAGKFHHIKGNYNKATAVNTLKKLYSEYFKDLYTVALGDSRNDLEMLSEADMAVVIRHYNGAYDESLLHIKNAYYTRKPGPEGWAEAIEHLLTQWSSNH